MITGLIFFLVSCQKEISNEDKGSGGVSGLSSVGLLSKINSDYGNGAQQELEYFYDSKNRLVRENQIWTAPGSSIREAHIILVRNADGIITKASYSYKGAPDSLIITPVYNTATKKYTSSVSRGAVSNLGYDSLIYIYNALGQIAELDEYIASPSGGATPVLGGKSFYSHDAAGNIKYTKFVYYNYFSGVEEVNGEVYYTYDASINPLVLNFTEAVIVGDATLTSPNNVIKMDYRDIASAGTNNMSYDVTYKYTIKNKPATSSITQSNGNLSTNTYTYK